MMSCDAAIILLHVLSIAIVRVCFADVHGHNCNALFVCRRRSVAGYDPTDPRAITSPYLSSQGHNVLDVKFCKLSLQELLNVASACISENAILTKCMLVCHDSIVHKGLAVCGGMVAVDCHY